MRQLSSSPRKAFVSTCVLTCILAGTSTAVSAAEFTRQFTIQSMETVSIHRPSNLQAQRLIRIFSNGAAPWGNSTCRADSADIWSEDWHLFSVALTALKNNISVAVTVESTERVDTGDTVCRAVSVHALP